jgi:hypothetical protein
MLLIGATINSEIGLNKIKCRVLYSVIPACRESFLKNDPGQAGMTKRMNMYDPEAAL